jgi:hypothetical protein
MRTNGGHETALLNASPSQNRASRKKAGRTFFVLPASDTKRLLNYCFPNGVAVPFAPLSCTRLSLKVNIPPVVLLKAVPVL